MCERLSLPAANLYPADDLTLEQAASIEFLAIGAHGVSRSGVAAGTRTLVIGVGPIGLGAALFASTSGGVVWLMDRDPDRLLAGAGLIRGAGAIVADDAAPDAVRAATGGNGFDVVIDATGNRLSMERAFGYVAHGGTYLLLGVVRDDIAFSDAEFHKREMTLRASRNAVKADFDAVRAAIAQGLIPVQDLITHRTTLAGAVTDLPQWTSQKRGLIKALISLD
jgi:2-desacetyl-2-hydroxyethyl bacteriochlorophyllide A dehydrogenase